MKRRRGQEKREKGGGGGGEWGSKKNYVNNIMRERDYVCVFCKFSNNM